MKKILNTFVALITLFAVASCSLASPSTQPVTVKSSPSGAKIYANGEYAGVSPTVVNAKKNQTLALIAKKNGKVGTTTVNRQLSGTGVADIVGGLALLVPFIGLASPGAWKLEQDQVLIPITE